MQHDTPDIDTTALREELTPMPDAVARMRTSLHASMTADALAPAAPRRPAPRRRRVTVALAGAIAIALAVALSPFDQDVDSGSSVLAPTSAEAALEQAANAAGSAPWAPLAEGEYHHTMTTTFTPKIPVRANDPQKKIDQMFAGIGPSSQEAWIDREGLGMSLDVTGGNGDPDLYPKVSNDGWGMQPTYGRRWPELEVVDVAESLRLADLVRVAKSLPNQRAADSMWYRTPTGFRRYSHRTGAAMTDFKGGYADFVQQRHWEATIEQIDAVNGASDADRPAAISRLLDQQADGFANAGMFGTPGKYGVTKATQREDSRIVRAIELLGSAPLSPAVRQDLFTWLSNRPTAKLEGASTDVSGRAGTRVTFERVFEQTVPARTVTVDDLFDEIEANTGTRPNATVPGPQSFLVKRDHQFRRMYVSILFDTQSGELLEYVLYGRVETTAQQPRLENFHVGRPGTNRRPTWKVRKGVERQGMSDAKLYGIRERTTDFGNAQTAACEAKRFMCR